MDAICHKHLGTRFYGNTEQASHFIFPYPHHLKSSFNNVYRGKWQQKNSLSTYLYHYYFLGQTLHQLQVPHYEQHIFTAA